MRFFKALTVSVTTEKHEREGRLEFRAGGDGLVHEPCWFCGKDVELQIGDGTGDAAALMVEPLGAGDPIRSICHRSCAERAKGSIGFGF